MEPIYLFTLSGAFAMGSALSARQIMQDTMAAQGDDTDAEASAEAVSVSKRYLIAGNLAVVAFILSMAYGWQEFAWWIPAAFLVVTFPALYYVFLNRLLKPKGGALIYGVAAWAALVPVIMDWIA